MGSLTQQLTVLVARSFEACGLDPKFGEVVVSQRPELGQFQCNGALPAARIARKSPRDVAQAVVDALSERAWFADVSLAGPGFVNLTLTDEALAAFLRQTASDERLGCDPADEPEVVLIDFGGPNVAKAMHVGHLRSSIIGDCLQRLFRFAGHRVVSDVHLGDWGTQMGMLICEMRRRRPDLPYFDAGFAGPYPAEPPVTIDDLEQMYPAVSARCKEDDVEADAARQATVDLQEGRPGYRALWQHFVDVSLAGLRRDFGRLGVTFDLWLGESHAHSRIAALIERLKAQGFAARSEGAWIVPLGAGEGEGKELPPLLLVKSDGAVLYGTTDLATLEERVQDVGARRVLYVVDQRQALHFQQVFRAARLTGVAGETALEHIAFGTVNGPDGKPFKTRTGGVMRLQDLIGLAVEQVARRMEEAGVAQGYSEEERRDIAHKVGLAAVKFADLSNHRLSNYIFDLDKFTRFEGKTGPYLQYAAVRIQSILRKAEERGLAPGELLAPSATAERDLMLRMGQLPDAVGAALAERAPNFLCEHLYELSQAWSRFYQQCHILSEPDEARRDSWLALAALCLRQIQLVLHLLGIEVPERM
ncbi:MAG: arginine--tRNA ligase [Deltaproteobacteria bacterium]|nr:arginine--tRNA ligase [Deltaproteobacteria bacterium]